MKKIFVTLAIAGFMIACNDSSTDDSSTTNDTATPSETTAPAPSTTDTSSAMKDGVMQMKDGKMVVMTAGSWQPMTETVTCTNGRKVAPNGEVSKGDRKRKLDEGMMIDRDGQIMDKDGKMVDNTGWE